MGTRFEILLHGQDAVSLRAAGEEALEEIERLDRQLSLFRRESDLSLINARAAKGPVPVEPGFFRLLLACRELSAATEGAFDITVGPLMDCWGFRRPRSERPSAEELQEARNRVGFSHLRLDEDQIRLRFDRPGILLDLGAVAKGWALDQAASMLREAGITSALLHGGTSSAYALGAPPEADRWTIAIRPPPAQVLPEGREWPGQFLYRVALRDESLSVSAVAGRQINLQGEKEAHVIHPVRGIPVRETLLAAVVAPEATAADAFSTGLLAGGASLHRRLRKTHPLLRQLLLVAGEGGAEILSAGFEESPRRAER